MGDKYSYVGHTFALNDAQAKATGELKYASDLALYGTKHIKLVLSTCAHGDITEIETSEALAMPGVKAVFTWKNSPDKGYSTYRRYPDMTMVREERKLFARHVRFAGEVVAAVVADTLEQACDAAMKVKASYKDIPVITDPLESLRENAYPIHDGGNLLEEFLFEPQSVYERTVDESDEKVFKAKITTQKMSHIAMENHAYSADYSNNEITLWTPTQGVFGVRITVADLLGMPYDKVRVIKVPMGGSFGGKQEYIFEPLVAYIALTLKCPVKLHLDRRESTIATTCRSDLQISIEMAFAPDGAIQSCYADCLTNAGAYAGNAIVYAHSLKSKITRLYRFPKYSYRGRAIYTNAVPNGGMRGWGSPEMATVFEIYMDRAAVFLGIDQVKLRLRNLLNAEETDISKKASIGNARAVKCLTDGALEFRWDERVGQPKGTGRYRKGIGVSSSGHNNGFFSATDLSTMTMRMNEDGTVSVQATLHEVGCGTIRSMQIIIGEVLHVSPDRILVTEGDTKFTPYDQGSYGSRVTYVTGKCAFNTAVSFNKLMLEAASETMNIPETSIDVKDGIIYNKNNHEKKMSFGELASYLIMKKSRELIHTESFTSISNPGSYSANFAEVEVDTYTGLIRVTDFLSVNDVGQAINQGIVHRQIEGAVQMALGYGLCEDLAINEHGHITKDVLSKYHTLNGVDMPHVRSILIEDGGDDGPFGAKGIGESAAVAGAAAVVNAVNNALGTSITELPLSPERIMESLVTVK